MTDRDDDQPAGRIQGDGPGPGQDDRKGDRDLNPRLRTRTDTTHDTRESSRPPSETASVQREEGRAWPVIWLAVAVVGLLVALYILFW